MQKTKRAKKLMSLIMAFALMLTLFTFVPASVSAAGDTVSTVSAGSWHTMAIKGDGNLWAWGSNGNGQLGDGTDDWSPIPVKIMDDVVQVSAGDGHSMALKGDGSLWAWGTNRWYGQLGDGTTTNRYWPMKIMDDVVQVSAGNEYTMAIKSDGSLWAWGNNYAGQLGNGTTTGLLEANPTPTKIMDDVIQVSAGVWHTMAIKSDGSLWGWGNNYAGRLGDGTKEERLTPTKIMDDVIQVSVGLSQTLVIKSDGTLWAWGANDYGQLGDGTNTDSPTPIKIMDDVIQVSAGYEHTMAIKSDGTLWAWGSNGNGELGDGTTTDSPTPIKIMDQVAQVSAGVWYTMAIKSDGSLWAWGNNNDGQLGDGSTTESFIPIKIMDGVMLKVGTPTSPTTYAVTVSAGTGATGGGSYEQGDTVNITAGTAPTGQRFKNWTTTSDGVTLVNANSASTSFTMPANAVTVTANFEDISTDPEEPEEPDEPEEPLDPLKGHVLGNDNIGIGDAQLAFRAALKLVTLVGDPLDAADLDGNGTVEISEAMRIFRYALKLSNVL